MTTNRISSLNNSWIRHFPRHLILLSSPGEPRTLDYRSSLREKQGNLEHQITVLHSVCFICGIHCLPTVPFFRIRNNKKKIFKIQRFILQQKVHVHGNLYSNGDESDTEGDQEKREGGRKKEIIGDVHETLSRASNTESPSVRSQT